jgi:L-fuconate dehydratase
MTADTKIVDLTVRDIRFPTSKNLYGSDAMNPDPDYSTAYVELITDDPNGLKGHGHSFTLGRGTELCVAAINSWKPFVVGKTVEEI